MPFVRLHPGEINLKCHIAVSMTTMTDNCWQEACLFMELMHYCVCIRCKTVLLIPGIVRRFRRAISTSSNDKQYNCPTSSRTLSISVDHSNCFCKRFPHSRIYYYLFQSLPSLERSVNVISFCMDNLTIRPVKCDLMQGFFNM